MNSKTTVLKRIGAAALAISMTAALAACGGGSTTGSPAPQDSSAPSGSTEKTKLTFWCHENEPWIKAYNNMADKFEAEHPEYEVEVVSYPMSVYSDKIQTALTSATEDCPDIVAVWGGMAPAFVETDGLSPVPDDLAAEMKEDYLEPTLGIYTKEGTFYGVPMEYNLEYGGMVVNKKLFDEAGLSYPTTWEELRTISKQVAVQDGDIVTTKGFEMIDSDALICNYLAMILQQGGQYIMEDNTVNFATDEGVTAMEEILSMVRDGECDLDNLTAGEYCFNDVYSGNGYMSSVGTWAIGEGTDGYGLTQGVDFEYVPVPQYGETMAFASETGWGIIVPKNGGNVDAAWEFVKFFSQPENLVEHNIACNQLPPRKSLLTNETYLEAMPDIAFILDIMPYGQWMGPYNTSAMRKIFNQTFINLCQDESLDVREQLEQCSAEISAQCMLSYN